MYFAVVSSPADDLVIIKVYIEDVGQKYVEVPITPNTSCQDVVNCTKEPGRESGYIVVIKYGTEHILSYNDNIYSLLQLQGKEKEHLVFVLHYGSVIYQDDMADLPSGRRAQLRKGVREQQALQRNKIPGGMDLSITELQDMATRQQQHIDNQQQILMAKEQRLKYLKQQEYQHEHLSSERERLNRLRDKVDAQEMKIKKLRSLPGQVEQQKANNVILNTELDSVKAMFNEKEKELSMAVARVEQLTRQLEDLKNAKLHGITGDTRDAAAAELEKLKKELLMKNQLYTTNKLSGRQEVYKKKKADLSQMDDKIEELQLRLKKRKSQLALNRMSANQRKKPIQNIAAVEPYVQHVPTKNVPKEDLSKSGHNLKQGPKFQSLPQNLKSVSEKPKQLESDLKSRSEGPKEMNNNNVKAKIDNRISEWNKKISSGTVPSSFPTSRPVSYRLPQTSAQSTNAQNVPPRPSIVSNIANLTPKPFGSSSGVVNRVLGPVQQQPVISITEEERQAGSGQSSPASSDGAQTSPNTTATSTQPTVSIAKSQTQPLPPRTRISQPPAIASSVPVTRPTSRPPPPPPPVPSRITLPESAPIQPPPPRIKTQLLVSSSQDTPKSILDSVDSAKVIFDSPAPGIPQASSTPITGTTDSTIIQPSSPNGSQKPSYRYAPKSVIANTYMSRLGGAAFAKYQNNLNEIYKPKDPKTEDSPNSQSSTDSNGSEQKTTFTTRQPVISTTGPVKASHAHFGMMGSPQHTNITSDKVSYKLNTPKHIRRRHSDSENEEVTKMLNRAKEKNNSTVEIPAKSDNLVNVSNNDSKNQQIETKNQPSDNKNQLNDNKNNSTDLRNPSSNNKIQPNDIRNHPTKIQPNDIRNHQTKNQPIDIQNQPNNINNQQSETKIQQNDNKNQQGDNKNQHKDKIQSNTESEKIKAPEKVKVVKRGRSNLKGNNPNKSKNRVSFDPLALLLDASLEGELEMVKTTASQVADVSAPNDEGITALHNAICAGHYEIVKFLLEFGCDVNSPDSDGWTPLHCAASCNNLPMVKLLVEHGACIFATTISDHETAAEKCEEDEDGYDGCSDYLYSIQEKLGIMHNGEVWAVFDYEAANADELSFAIWDKMIVLRKGDDKEKEWWWARLDGKEGYIAKNLLGLYPRVRPKSP